MKKDCPICHGIGWVGEKHPDEAYDIEIGCICSAGMPCECNTSDPPYTSQVIVQDIVTLH
jgi:hypothetical protein